MFVNSSESIYKGIYFRGIKLILFCPKMIHSIFVGSRNCLSHGIKQFTARTSEIVDIEFDIHKLVQSMDGGSDEIR